MYLSLSWSLGLDRSLAVYCIYVEEIILFHGYLISQIFTNISVNLYCMINHNKLNTQALSFEACKCDSAPSQYIVHTYNGLDECDFQHT